MASHRGQYEFIRNLLSGFFGESGLQAADRYNVAVFNRKHNDEPFFKMLAADFTSDLALLSKQVVDYKMDNRNYPSSDLYMAIEEAIDLLTVQTSENNIGAVIAITAGINIRASGAVTERAEIVKKSIERNIPVYVVQYPIFGRETPDITRLAKDCYGKIVSTGDWRTALPELQNFCRELEARHYGQDYRITFKTSQKRDGKQYSVNIEVDRLVATHFFTAPQPTLWERVREEFLAPAITLLVVIVGIIAWIVFMYKRQKRRDTENKKQLETLKLEQEARERHQKLTEQAQAKKAKQAAEQQKMAELASQMRRKNPPNLHCSIGNNHFTHTIHKPVTTIGRDSSNDLIFKDEKVSGKHAQIVFNGRLFEIVDCGSKNGVIVNKRRVERAVLNNADIIRLGDANIRFHS